jgi:hypothetical protein
MGTEMGLRASRVTNSTDRPSSSSGKNERHERQILIHRHEHSELLSCSA